MSDARSINMEKRRKRILLEARQMLAIGGYDSLTLRDLAAASEVTAPTIYNLIGNKAAVLKALVLAGFEDYEAALNAQPPCPTEQLATQMMDTFTEMVASDEAYFRATVLASERLENESEQNSDYGFKRAPLRVYSGTLCRRAKQEGLLRGLIDSDILVEQMIGGHQRAFKDWAHRLISLQQLKQQSLQSFYVALAADAEDAFRDQLTQWLKQR